MSLEAVYKEKRVFISGAGRGIGRAVTKRLYSYGAIVYALSKDSSHLESLKIECPSINTITCDLSNWTETKEKLKDLERMDFLLNNAAVMNAKSILQFTPAEVDQVFDVNIKGSLNVTQSIAQKMAESGKGGSICFLSSVLGTKPVQLVAPYCISKSAIDMMAKCLALELGPNKIRVNVVKPVRVDTDMHWSVAGEVAKALNIDPMTLQADQEDRMPYPGFFMEMEAVVNLILFTMSDLCPQLTGTAITMDGGFTL